MSDVHSCGQCGVTLPDDSPDGVCPSCLMRLGMGHRDTSPTQFDPARRQSYEPPKPHELAPYFPQLEILDLIGQGGMGAVYKARQVGLDRIVALKILPPHDHDDGSFAGRFEREARSLARLSHPHIVTVFDSGHSGDFYYFVMEFVDGVNLRDAINAGTLTPSEALAIVPQICDALQYAHDEGIVHRDIKPENVLIDRKGKTRIADFGLARLLGPTTDVTLTGTHQVMGTPRYMSPEQMEGSHDVDHRADIYSLGVVFYEMLTGELPMGRFDGPSKKVQVDVRLDEVVFRTLEKEPARRYQHASEIKTDVQAICASRRGAGSPRFVGPQHHHHFEYKSEAHLFGWPLVHIAYGTDPQTGKLCRATGIIACGNIACGVVAIGTFAFGGIAIGAGAVGGLALGGSAIGALTVAGISLGLFSFGGLAVGLLVAAGGLALGFGLSYGGVAIGAVAQGGLAIGWYANAGHGLAYGVHALGSNMPFPDTRAQGLFAFFATMDARSIFVGVGMIALITCLTGTLVSLRALRHQRQGTPTQRPPKDRHAGWESAHDRRHAPWGVLLVVLLFGGLAAMCIVVILGLGVRRDAVVEMGASEISRGRSTTIELSQAGLAEQLNIESSPGAFVPAPSTGEMIDWIEWTTDGPTLSSLLGMAGKRLSAQQWTKINEVLREAHAAYVELEQEHLEREKNANGHWVTTIRFDDPNALDDLENHVWTQLDAIVDVDWQKLLRDNLRFQSPGDIGVLGFEGQQGSIEIWKVGSWFHWQLTTISARRGGWMTPISGGSGMMSGGMDMGMGGMGSMSSGGGEMSGSAVGMGGLGGGLGEVGLAPPAGKPSVRGAEYSGPELPIRFRRFWHQPAATGGETSR